MKTRKQKITTAVLFVVALFVAFIMILPFIWMVSASFKLKTEIFTVPIRWIPETFHMVNYETIMNEIPFPRYFMNTAKITIIITFLQVITCSMAAYAFSKLHFPGRDKLFLAYLGTMMIPWYAIMIPQFIIIQKLHLYDNHLSLILTGAFSAFGVFLLRQNMITIPDSLNEAAKIDGCGPVGIYLRIILPLSKGGLATLVILTFNNVGNDYMGPMLYLDSNLNRTIKREFDTNYGAIMAGTVISLIPIVIVYVFAQKYIVEGIVSGAVKG